MRKRIFNFAVLAAAASILASCASYEEIPAVADQEKAAAMAEELVPVTFTATFEQDEDTRTTLDVNDWMTKWSSADKVTIFARYTKTGNNDEFKSGNSKEIKVSDDGYTATFKVDIHKQNDYTLKEYYAIYPTGGEVESGKIKTSLATTQPAKVSSFADGVNLAAAKSTDTATSMKDKGQTLLFHNLCALLSFTVGNDDIVSAKLTANSGAGLAGGTALIDFSDSIPVMDATGDSGVTLSCEGNSTFTKGSKYYFVVYPGTYTGGFTITFKDKNGMVATMTSSEDLKLARKNNVNLGTVTVPANKWAAGEVGVYKNSDNSVIRKYTKYSDQLVWSVKPNVNGFRIQDITARTFFNISNLPATYTDNASFKASITQNVIDGVDETFEDTVTVTNIDDELVRLTGSTYYYIIKK